MRTQVLTLTFFVLVQEKKESTVNTLVRCNVTETVAILHFAMVVVRFAATSEMIGGYVSCMCRQRDNASSTKRT